MVCGLVSGARKPISTEPWPSPRIASGSGGAIVSTASLPQTACGVGGDLGAGLGEGGVVEQGLLARALCTTTSMPFAFSLAMTSGTSATRCSPAAVSFGTPIRIAGAGTYPIGQPDAGRGRRRPPRAHRCATLAAGFR